MTDKIDELVDRLIERGGPTLDKIIRERDELRAEVERLKAALQAYHGQALAILIEDECDSDD